jgi:hypothetical protein
MVSANRAVVNAIAEQRQPSLTQINTLAREGD